VCSLKPTYRRVSVDGVLPLAPTMDHVGVMANCVRDLAVVFQAIAGVDERHPATLTRVVEDVFADERIDRQADSEAGPNYIILDSTRDFFPQRTSPPIRDVTEGYIRTLTSGEPVRNRTCNVTAKALPAGFADLTRHHDVVMAVEAAAFHAARLERHPDDYPPRIRSLIERGLGHTALEYAAALDRRHKLIAACRTRFRFLITPATPTLPPSLETTGDPLFNSPWSFTGLPTVSFPVGRTTDGLPMAIQMVSNNGWEDELLRVADWCEAVAAFSRALPPIP
jgi:aspartyl-tRNA(Asn)/glutamyl-tRNA(Gln) amidotransferase subunit A